jgi:molybdopterin-guanine dinucleotide biosynthesis protein B
MKNVVSFIGFSNSGKTALICSLVGYLSRRGYRVGVIKHTTKDFQVDRKGKDSHRIYSSGADVVVLSPVKTAMLLHKGLPLKDLAEFFAEYDLVLTEGFKREFERAIAVAKSLKELDELLESLEDERKSRVLAAVVDESGNYPIPLFKPDQIEELAEFILSRLE